MAKPKKSTTREEVLDELKNIGESTEKITKKLLEGVITRGLPTLNKKLKDTTASLQRWVKSG